MRSLSSKKLKEAEKLLAEFDREISEITFDVPSMLQYCIEKDLRDTFRQKRFKDAEIDTLLKKSNFYIKPKAAGVNKVKFSVNRNSIYNINNSVMSSNF